ncbi:hypothetical protein [Microbacterium elymi]|uniref:Uncharacterized protein n=1 Tax=Microbacterium elymi TaxID=2909587 RepID=A0ABY5NLA9_9MICO|nr:hypothetical protein [Microbacterium elymi]UUT35861.1 hypothetical protein L2X98_22100 [Microbacterium elymi]
MLPPVADVGPLTLATRSGSLTTGSITPLQIGGGSDTAQFGRADAGNVVTKTPVATMTTAEKMAVRRDARRFMSYSLDRE